MQSQEERIQEHGRLLSATGVSIRYVVAIAAFVGSGFAALVMLAVRMWIGG